MFCCVENSFCEMQKIIVADLLIRIITEKCKSAGYKHLLRKRCGKRKKRGGVKITPPNKLCI